MSECSTVHSNSGVPTRDHSPVTGVETTSARPSLVALVLASSILLAATVAVGLFWPSSALEVDFLLWIRDTFGNSLDDIMHLMDVVGDVGTVSIALLALAVLVGSWRGVRPAAAVLVTGMAAMLVNIGLKVLVGRPRPGLWAEVDSSYSLPSGHVLLFAVFALLVYEMWPWDQWRRPMAIAGLLLVGLMGFSRLYLGEHYPTDVVASFSIAILLWAGYRNTASRYPSWSRRRVR